MLATKNLDYKYEINKINNKLFSSKHFYQTINLNFNVKNMYNKIFNIKENTNYSLNLQIKNEKLESNAKINIYVNNSIIFNDNNAFKLGNILNLNFNLYSTKSTVNLKIECDKNVLISLNLTGLLTYNENSIFNILNLNSKHLLFLLNNKTLSIFQAETLNDMQENYRNGLSFEDILNVVNYGAYYENLSGASSYNNYYYLTFKNNSLVVIYNGLTWSFSNTSLSEISTMFCVEYNNYNKLFISKVNGKLYYTFANEKFNNKFLFDEISCNIMPTTICKFIPVISEYSNNYVVCFVDCNNNLYYANLNINKLINGEKLNFIKICNGTNFSVIVNNNVLNVFCGNNKILKHIKINLELNNKEMLNYENITNATIVNNKKVILNNFGIYVEN